ncbi:MFS transporter [Nocardia sp. NPDC057668]|uniref:MFS transporter n=1 Tax=Nocardia sp. NPDC057668 TaxID=3346202 RepID=UPI00366E3BDD
MTSVEVAPKAGVREWVALAVLCLPTMLAAVDINIMFLALPSVSADLGATGAQQLWIMDIYGFLITGFLVTMGTLGDRVGRRRVLLVGAAAFLASSLLAAYSTFTGMLIGARALMGIAGAAVTPSVLALIRTMFKDPKQLGAAMGIWGTSLVAGIVLGPVVGGLLLGSFWWGSIFLIGAPIMALLLILGPFLVPESRNPAAGRLDLVSVAISMAALLPLIYGLKEIGRTGWEVPPIASVLAGIVFLALFLRRQRQLEHPLLDLSLFSIKALSISALLALLAPLISGGVMLMVILYMQLVKGLSPLSVGTWMLAPSIALIMAGGVASGVVRKVRPAYVLAVGALVAAIGMGIISQVSTTSGLGLLMAGLIASSIGGGVIGILSATLIMTSAPEEKAGSAGSLSASLGEFGTALGVAPLLGLVGTVVYRLSIDVPSGITGGAADAARESIAGAAVTAAETPAPSGPALLSAAQEAFTSGLSIVATIAAVFFIGLAVLAITGLEQVLPQGEEPTAAEQPAPLVSADVSD